MKYNFKISMFHFMSFHSEVILNINSSTQFSNMKIRNIREDLFHLLFVFIWHTETGGSS